MPCSCFARTAIGETLAEKINNCKCSCGARFVVEENGRRFQIQGTVENVDKIKVDGCLCSDQQTKKCDYLFIYKNGDVKLYVFVELKGKNIETAIKQLVSTIEIFCSEGILNSANLKAFIVSSKYPSHDSTYRSRKAKFEKLFSRYRAEIRQKNNSILYNPITNSIS